MSEYSIVTIAIAVLCVIMLLFGICYALFAIVGLLQKYFYLYGGFDDDSE